MEIFSLLYQICEPNFNNGYELPDKNFIHSI